MTIINLKFQCPLCNPEYIGDSQSMLSDCPRCGHIEITHTFLERFRALGESDRIKIMIYSAKFGMEEDPLRLDASQLEMILSSYARASVTKIADNLIILIAKRMPGPGAPIKVRKQVDYPRVGAETAIAFGEIMNFLDKDEMLSWKHKSYTGHEEVTEVALSFSGWKHYEKIEASDSGSGRVKVNVPAMISVPGWQTIEAIGAGGQGSTFKVIRIDSPTQSGVLKVIRCDKLSPKSKERMRREIEASRKLEHPHIIKILDHGILADESPYYVSEFCDGGNISSWVSSSSRSPEDALSLFEGISMGLIAVHKQGIVHRDIKPENILLKGTPPVAVIADFGICHADNGQHSVTSTHELVGPRDFMAPELEPAGDIEPRPTADIYSLGKVLYFLLAGRIFRREIFRHPNWDLAKTQGGKFEAVNRVFDRMITEKPEARFQSVEEVLGEVNQLKQIFRSKANVIHPKVYQECIYCGIGKYRQHNDLFDTINRKRQGNETRKESRIFFLKYFMTYPGGGSEPSANMDWKVLRCDYCGNVQVFWPNVDGGEGSDVEKRWYSAG